MAEISIVRPQDRALDPVMPKRSDAPPSGIKLQVIGDGLDGHPYVHLTEVPAGHYIDTHSHSEDEVTIIMSGRVKVNGTTMCDAGTVLVVPANQNYSLEAGTDEPLTFVVVRPRKASFAFVDPTATDPVATDPAATDSAATHGSGNQS